MRFFNKRGEMTTKEIIELVLSAAVIIVLVILFFTLLQPYFNQKDETSESYFNSLEDEIGIASGGEVGEFFIWDIESSDKASYHLVYFGNRLIVSNEDIEFRSKGAENNICICSVSVEKGVCNYCSSLNKPSSLDGNAVGEFVISKGEKVLITETEDNYEFRKV